MNIKAFITLILSCLLLLGSFAFAKDDAPHSSRTESSFRSSDQYRINGDGTVTDTKTGLMWKRCSEGQSGDSCSGEATKYKWEDVTDSDFASYLYYFGTITRGTKPKRTARRENLRSSNVAIVLHA